MATNEMATKPNMIQSFRDHLAKSDRIVALLGAGLSATSGLPTFRGAGGLWRNNDATSLATPEAFARDPSLVWQFYNYRRHMALNALPNPAHYALADLAKRNRNFLTLSQNVDGLSPRAGHPGEQLKLLHGSLYDIKCFGNCGYVEKDNFTDPVVPALAIPQDKQKNETNPLIKGIDISSTAANLPSIPKEQLPQCPSCKKSLLRPGVVWFGETLPEDVMADVDGFFKDGHIDLMLVIGTSAAVRQFVYGYVVMAKLFLQVYPAAGYIRFAKYAGARIAVINPDKTAGEDLDAEDWFFCDDAASILPELLTPINTPQQSQ